MATLTLGATVYEIRPFRFRELKKAAPVIDRIGARAKSGAARGLVGRTDGVADILEVLAIGIDGKSADDLDAELTMADVPGLQNAFVDLLAESGLKPAGELRPAKAPADPSQTESTTSLQNWSPPDVATGIGLKRPGTCTATRRCSVTGKRSRRQSTSAWPPLLASSQRRCA